MNAVDVSFEIYLTSGHRACMNLFKVSEGKAGEIKNSLELLQAGQNIELHWQGQYLYVCADQIAGYLLTVKNSGYV